MNTKWAAGRGWATAERSREQGVRSRGIGLLATLSGSLAALFGSLAALVGLLAAPAWGQMSPPIERAPDPLEAEAVPVLPETGHVALYQFTTAVENREPIDQITFVENDVRKVFFFSDLRELTGTVVVHRWSYADEVRAEVRFEVGGPRWRVWSSKEMDPAAVGDWTVEVVAENDEVLAAETFTYSPAAN